MKGQFSKLDQKMRVAEAASVAATAARTQTKIDADATEPHVRARSECCERLC